MVNKERRWTHSDTTEAVSVMTWVGETGFGRVSIAQASDMGNGDWFLNRVKVADKDQHQGLGTKMLTAMKDLLEKRPGFVKLIVTPGGYTTPQEVQIAFYAKNGFVMVGSPDVTPHEWHMEWSGE